MKISKDIYDCELHESVTIESDRGMLLWRITRVPGGWIYEQKSNLVFVPFYNELKKYIPTENTLDTTDKKNV